MMYHCGKWLSECALRHECTVYISILKLILIFALYFQTGDKTNDGRTWTPAEASSVTVGRAFDFSRPEQAAAMLLRFLMPAYLIERRPTRRASPCIYIVFFSELSTTDDVYIEIDMCMTTTIDKYVVLNTSSVIYCAPTGSVYIFSTPMCRDATVYALAYCFIVHRYRYWRIIGESRLHIGVTKPMDCRHQYASAKSSLSRRTGYHNANPKVTWCLTRGMDRTSSCDGHTPLVMFLWSNGFCEYVGDTDHVSHTLVGLPYAIARRDECPSIIPYGVHTLPLGAMCQMAHMQIPIRYVMFLYILSTLDEREYNR